MKRSYYFTFITNRTATELNMKPWPPGVIVRLDQPEGPSHQRAWYPLVNLWMVMAALRWRRYFLRANQQRMVFWMRMQAARNLSALNFSK